ncbi:protein SPMIP1 [Paramormyrops kingsleyae]|uniref:protein SPMIP1 n=1 Tax=Paramormyrops kingsleyae TaxID=1676925 RepID=UPI000CD638F4|nr:uncharacterized protein LOC111837485 [Paramormyrops kingsleyae]XP_023655351.1 uncharacterized protein LOC111837485 [Paramormyrops kingsleyae]XP_023655352.1 uncharacterized protein LOC111837485 [Paramormyrops kingsleyae]XP_023655353.1 uncharacterized protein LOC111837485 [Paramormyrops kingsleyae]
MLMRGPLTTQNQNCYRQLIEKEAYTRLAWKIKYGQEYPSRIAATFRAKKEPGLPKLPAAETILPPIVKREVQAVPEPKLDLKLKAPLMRPVTPKTRETLYDGISTEGKGRALYMRQRLGKGPEEKFDHPQLSSWEYGWKLGDYGIDYRSPVSGRSGIVRSTFYARNGIFNVPSSTDSLG